MKRIGLRSLMVTLLSLILAFFLIFSASWNVFASEEARLGSSISEVLLHWKLMVLKENDRSSYLRDSGLDSSLVSLQKSLKDLDAPYWLRDRFPALREKLERAKTEDVWPYQFGFWNFAQEDPTVSLSGTEKDEDILVDRSGEEEANSGRLGFRYLKFSDGEDEAVIRVGDMLDTPLSESFTLEFWVRLREGSTGKVVKSGNWNLELDDNLPVVEDSSGDRFLEGREIPLSYWTHIALIWDGKKVGLYQNGNEVNESTYQGSLNISKEIVFGGGLVGDIDDLRIKKRSVRTEYLNFDRPIDYLIGFPTLGWAQTRFGPEELWHFYAGLLISNLSLKRDSNEYSVSSKDVKRVADFLLTEDEENLKLPASLPDSAVENIENMRELKNVGEMSKEKEREIERFIESLVNYLDLG